VCQLDGNGCTGWVATGQCAAGERCEAGVCIPPCQDACAEGSARCADGAPQTCQRAATGCTVWQTGAACLGDESCVAGACRTRCTADEFETCPTGFACTGTAEGRVCLPQSSVPDAGATTTPDAGSAQPGSQAVGVEDEAPQGPSGVRAMGCGCTFGAQALLPLGGFLVLGARRRRQR
jgi:MYXO-CTERM domain-containing protein